MSNPPTAPTWPGEAGAPLPHRVVVLAQEHVSPFEPGIPAVLDLVPPQARIASICTGGFTLAAAGLLGGRLATTHGECARAFRSWYPAVRPEEDVLFVRDGRVHTSAGAAAGLDLCVDLVRTGHGARVANAAARRCVVPAFREGGQAQFVDRPVSQHADSTTRAHRTASTPSSAACTPCAVVTRPAGWRSSAPSPRATWW